MNKDEVEKEAKRLWNRLNYPHTKPLECIADVFTRLTEKAYREGYKTAIADVHMMPKVRTEAEASDE